MAIERPKHVAKNNPVVIKHLALIYVVYDGTNYILMIHNGMAPFKKKKHIYVDQAPEDTVIKE